MPFGIKPLYVLIGFVAALAVLIVLRVVTKKRFLNSIIAVVVVAGLALLAWPLLFGRPTADPLAGGQVYTVARGQIAEVVEATGNLQPVSQASLTFSVGGRLKDIYVATGERVYAGEVLARLDTADLELQLDQARAGLNVAEANLAKITANARPEDVRVASSSLSQAQTNLDEQRASLAAATESARLSWVESANNLRDAQANYENIYWDNRKLEDKIGKENVPDSNYDNEAKAWRAVENAEASMEQARLAYEQAQQRQDASVSTSEDQVTTARANLQKLVSGATNEDVAAAQASIDQSHVSVDLAQAQLDKATLKAPFSGVVGTVLSSENDQVSAATPILVVLDPDSYQVDVEVDEVDIPKVRVGQPVSLTLDALPDVELPAKVTEIALFPTSGQGVVTYRVRVQLSDLRQADVRPGMTANVRIITRQMSDVLIVPRRAVRIEDGQAYVQRVLPSDVLEKVPVTMGLQDSFFAEVTTGLQEGDQVFVEGVVQNAVQQVMEDASSGQSPQMPMNFRPGQ